MSSTEPVLGPVVSRRRVLAGGAVLAALGVTATGCGGPPPPPKVDELKAQSALALHDSELAGAAAADADPPTAATLRQVAADRARHAQALDTEITRLAGTTSSATQTTSAPPTPSGPPPPPPPVADVVNALRAAADSARQLALTSSGYRAGLLASIVASCTAAYTVALAPGEPVP